MFTKTERESNTFSLAMSNTGKSPTTGFRMFRKNGGTSGPLVLENVAIFRSGTFRNSWGEQTTWTDFHIQSIVANYDFLKNSKTFEDVPVRVAHPEPWFRNSTEEVIGYVRSLRAEKLAHPGTGEIFTYLISDYEILDEEAAGKIADGLFKNRSAEIGMYSDNNDSEFFPVLTGFAYVDIPAVEGLNFGKRPNIRRFAMEMEGTEVPDTTDEVEKPDETEEVENTEPVGTKEVENAEPVETEEVVSDETTGSDEAIIATSGGTENFTNGNASQFSVTFNGQTITDPKAIQSLMDSLSGAVVQDRVSYVNSMFTSGRILAAQKGKAEEFVNSLSIEQFSQFREIFDDVPVNQTVAFNAGENATPPVAKDDEDEVVSLTANHLRLALGEDRFKATAFYKQHFGAGSDKDGN